MRLPTFLLAVSSLVLALPAQADPMIPPSPADMTNLTAIGIDAARAAGREFGY